MQKLFLILFIIPFGLFAQRTPLASQQLRFDAMTKMDTVLLQNILHSDLEYVHSNGLIETKNDFIHSVANQKIRYENIELLKTTEKKYGKTAVITGFCKVRGKINNNPFDIKLRYISIYRRKHGKWLLKSWQSLKLDK